MAKSPQRKPQSVPKPQPARQMPATRALPLPDFQLPAFFSHTGLQSLLLFAVSFLIYANTLGHGFVQDDAIVITDNMFTQQGVKGIGGILSKDTFFGFFKVEGKDMLVSGGRYRPFTLIIFALAHQIMGPNAFGFHLLTVLLFAATVVVLYRTVIALLQTRFGEGYAALVAWIAALLFAVHPIHTEVVANVKGCDEIVTLLGSLGALWLVLKAVDTGKMMWYALAFIAFFLASMSKENAATFVVIIPLALWYFRPDMTAGKATTASWPVFAGFMLFFVIRGAILHWKFGAAGLELMNNPYLKAMPDGSWAPFTWGEKMATIVYTLGKYVLLLIFPHPLTHDYYPRHVDMMKWSNIGVLASLFLYAAMAYFAVKGLKKRDVYSFSIWVYLLTLSIVSNVVFPIGTNMGERFAFMPSVGFCLFIAALLVETLRKENGWDIQKIATPLIIGGVVAGLYGIKTLTRNPVWVSNESLFFADVNTSSNSAKIRNACGGVLFDKARASTEPEQQKAFCTEALPHLDKALAIYKDYSDAYISRGGCHLLLGNYDQSVSDYRKAMQLSPGKEGLKTSLAMALREAGRVAGEKRNDLATALKLLNESWALNPADAGTARLFGVASGVSGNHPEAVKWFQKAVDLAPQDASLWFDLATAYTYLGDAQKAGELYQKAQQLNPEIMKLKGRK